MRDRIIESKTSTKFMLSLVMLFICTFTIEIANAVPADTRPIVVVLPDGTELTIKKHGDEFFNWTTNMSGHTIMQKSGYYYYVTYNGDGTVKFTNQRVSQNRTNSSERSFLTSFVPQNMTAIASYASDSRRRSIFSGEKTARFPNEGTIKSIVILVEYQDVRFVGANPNADFTDLLNKEGYSRNGATGSARDYFLKVSGGKFIGQFDVAGPYTLKEQRAYYGGNDGGGNDIRPREMIEEAATLASREVDFSQYDYDGDGVIDNVIIYYAGHNEAESAVVDAIWPHKWSVENSLVFNGVRLDGYACTSELRGYGGQYMAGIGTFCHEFSHVFGLNDHYDTDGYQGGLSHGLGYYDIMTSGSYNNYGNTPPMFNAFELEVVGWLVPKLFANNSGDITLKTIDHLEAYKIPTNVEGEYFMVENRQKNDPDNIWDRYIPASGLIITHIDKSSGAGVLWHYNMPNANVSHECFKFVVAGDASLAGNSNWDKVPYPYGRTNSFTAISHPRAVSWAGAYIPYNIEDISIEGLDAKFSVSPLVEQKIVNGVIYSSDGDLVENAVVKFNNISEEGDATGVSVTTTSNYRGEYYAEVISGYYKMSVSKSGYNIYEDSIVIEDGVYKLDATLVKESYESSTIPSISLSDYEYKPDIPVQLKLLHINPEDVIKWYVDGALVTDLVTSFKKGEHTIKAEVSRNKYLKYVVVKKIVVK